MFQVSLDNLVKGDIEIMEQKLKQSKFNLWSHLMFWPMLLSAILAGPTLYYWTALWISAEIILLITMIIASFKVEALKIV